MIVIALTALFFSTSIPAGLSPLRDDATYSFASSPDGKTLHALDSISGYFLENRGQVNELVHYYSTGNPSVAFRDDGIMFVVTENDKGDHGEAWPGPTDRFTADETLATKSFAYMLRFEGSNKASPVGINRLSFDSNFFFGNDPSNWRTSVPNFMEVAYLNLYDGIDLVYRQGENGVKYEFHVSPGADPAQIEMAYEGVDRLSLDSDGGMTASTAVGEVRDLAPVAYQGEDGIRCPFSLRGPASFGFACQGRDASRVLVIDPLVYSTFLGGTGNDHPNGIAMDASGSAHIVGITFSPDFPITPGAFDVSFDGFFDSFVVKLNPDGDSLAWATFLGGSGVEYAASVAVDALGNIYVVGNTNSTDFPVTTGAFDTSLNGKTDAYVAKFTRDGVLIWATYLGGTENDQGSGVALDSSGNVMISSWTESPDFPVTPGAFDVSYGGFGDAYITKLDPSGSLLLWSTFLGGSATDYLNRITLGADDSIYAAGETLSTDFPVTPGAFDTTYNGGAGGGGDAYIAKLNSTGSALVWATYLGGADYDAAIDSVLDNSGNLYVTGRAGSTDFPVTLGAFDETLGGSVDVFIARLDSTGGALLWATFLGGSDYDQGGEVAVDVAGNVCLAGYITYSADFPTTPGAFDTTLDGASDGFLAVLNPNGSGLLYATFFGGSGGDEIRSMVLDSSGYAYLVGDTWSTDFPVTPGSFDTTYNGASDGYVAKIGPVGPPNTPPVLAWTGEPNYVSDGLDPETGTTFMDFTYRVAYYDADNNPPAQIKVKIEKPLGTPRGTFQMSFDAWKGAPNNYTTGAVYTFSTKLPAGADFWYSFRATDGWDLATGPPTIPIDAPDVVADDPPVAVAHASPTVAHMDDVITFDATSSTDDFGIVAYKWDFGDGANGSNSVTTHTYASRGTFIADLTVWDAANQNDTDTVSVLIENRPPIANAGSDQTVTKKTRVTLDGTGSLDPDSDALTYSWVQTGGSVVALPGADSPTPTFTPPTSGIYTFQLTVDDGNGGEAADAVKVTATNTPPVAEAGPDQTARKNTLVALNGSLSSDSDGDILTFTWVNVSGPVVTLADAGTDAPTFTPARVGTYVFRLTVDDGDGGTSEDTVSVTVWGLPPIADLVARPGSSRVGAQIEFDASGSADPDGVIVDFAFLFGDGASMSGSAAVRNHSYAAPGLYVVKLTVTDDDGNVSTASVTIEITSMPPSAEANYKPLVAVIFAVVLLVAGLWSSKKKPWKGGKDRMAVAKAFAITSLPFILAEAGTGIVSFVTGEPRIPPFVGVGTAVDLAILMAGLVVALLRALRTGQSQVQISGKPKSL